MRALEVFGDFREILDDSVSILAPILVANPGIIFSKWGVNPNPVHFFARATPPTTLSGYECSLRPFVHSWLIVRLDSLILVDPGTLTAIFKCELRGSTRTPIRLLNVASKHEATLGGSYRRQQVSTINIVPGTLGQSTIYKTAYSGAYY